MLLRCRKNAKWHFLTSMDWDTESWIKSTNVIENIMSISCDNTKAIHSCRYHWTLCIHLYWKSKCPVKTPQWHFLWHTQKGNFSLKKKWQKTKNKSCIKYTSTQSTQHSYQPTSLRTNTNPCKSSCRSVANWISTFSVPAGSRQKKWAVQVSLLSSSAPMYVCV